MTKYTLAIKDWPETEQPRERLLKWGAEKLTDTELVAILLRVGNAHHSAIELARQMLQKFGGFRGLDSKSITELCEINGVGPAKAAQIKAAIEVGKRIFTQETKAKKKISSSIEVVNLLKPYMRDIDREIFKILLLTSRNNLIMEKTLFEGSLTESLVNPREIIKIALNHSAASIVFVHNHPSGNHNPSSEDKRITDQLVKACNLVGINVLDHIIIGNDLYFSFAENGMI